MKSNKVIIVLIVLLIIFAFLFYWFIGKDRMERRSYDLTMVTEGDATFHYYGTTWEKKYDIEDFNWKKMDVFLDGEYKGKYYIWHDDKWYIFDDNKEAINYTENFLAIKTNFEVKAKSFETENNTDNDEVYNMLQKNSISPNAELTVNTKSVVDMDGDSKEEEIYIVSNTFPMDSNPDYTFSIVFMKKDGNIYEIYKHTTENMYDGVRPYINTIIDTNNDGIYEILLSTSEYSTQKMGHILFEWDGSKFQKIIEN